MITTNNKAMPRVFAAVLPLLLMLTVNVFGQTTDIKVLLCKGDITLYNQGGKGGAVNINTAGIVIHKGDTIKMADKAELVLTSGDKAIVCKDKGKYGWEDLKTLIDKNGSKEMFSKFLSFLAKEMKPEHENYEDFAKSHMKEKGSVNRGQGCPDALMVMPAVGTVVIPGSVVFRWKSNGEKHFVFTIYAQPQDGAPMLKQDVNDTVLVLKAEDLQLKMGKSYYWQASTTDLPNCQRNQFSVLNPDSASVFESEVKSMKDFILTGSDLSILAVAAICEQHSMYADADNAYRKLLNDQPKREDIAQLYASFLGRLGLADEANAVIDKYVGK